MSESKLMTALVHAGMSFMVMLHSKCSIQGTITSILKWIQQVSIWHVLGLNEEKELKDRLKFLEDQLGVEKINRQNDVYKLELEIAKW